MTNAFILCNLLLRKVLQRTEKVALSTTANGSVYGSHNSPENACFAVLTIHM